MKRSSICRLSLSFESAKIRPHHPPISAENGRHPTKIQDGGGDPSQSRKRESPFRASNPRWRPIDFRWRKRARARASKNFRGGLPAFYWDHSQVLYIKLNPRLRSIYWCKKCTKKEKFQISIFSYILHFSDVSCILRCDLGFRAFWFGKLIIRTLTLISALDISPSCARELETIDSIRVS